MSLLPFLLAVLALGSCGGRPPAGGAGSSEAPGRETGNRPLLALSILPQRYFASRIGGGMADTLVLVGPGQDPHHYEPTPRQVSGLSGAGAWVLSGTEFEAALRPKIEALFPELPVIDGVEGVRFRSMDEESPDGERDGGGHGGRDPHTWLGPEGAKIMAAHILEALRRLDPVHAALYGENYRSLIGDIDETFGRLRRDLEPLRGSTVFVYHPAFGYFLDQFGIVQRAVETGGKEPTPRRLGRLIEDARKAGVRVVFVQAQFPLESAGTAARAAGAELAALDPLAEDWLSNIRRMGEALKEGGAR